MASEIPQTVVKDVPAEHSVNVPETSRANGYGFTEWSLTAVGAVIVVSGITIFFVFPDIGAGALLVLAVALITVLSFLTLRQMRRERDDLFVRAKLADDELIQARKRSGDYQTLFHQANDCMLVIEPGTEIILEANDRACEFYGLSRQELLGRTLKDFTQNVERGEKLMAELMETKSFQSYESVHYTADGGQAVFLINASLIEYDGRPAILTVNRDVTAAKQVTTALENNLSLLSSTFEATADAIVAIDAEHRIIKANVKFIEMWCLGTSLDDVLHPGEMVWSHIRSQLVDQNQLDRLLGSTGDNVNVDSLVLMDGRTIECHVQPQTVDGLTVGHVLSFRDVTERIRTENVLRESEARYRLLFDRNPYPMWVYDRETLRFLAVNEAATAHYGYSREEFLQLDLRDIRPSDDIPRLMEFLASVGDRQEIHSNSRHKKKDGTIIDVEVASQSLTFGGRSARIGLVTDVTERIKANAALRESEVRLRTLLNSMSEGLLQVDRDDRILYINNCICEMTGYSKEELIGADWSMLLVDEGPEFVASINERRRKGESDRYETRVRKKNGELMWVIIGGAPIFDESGQLVGSMGVFTDITERKRAEEQLLHDAFHDALTGLANRTLFMDHLRMAIERGRSTHSNMYAVLYLDFDRFKVINDSLGHAEGDRLLQYIARRLENCTRSGDLIARLGGDEFVILLSELVDAGEALLVAERILNDLKKAFNLDGREIFISTSIGIALSSSGHTNAEDMLRDADIAMYRAKSKGKAQYQIFDKGMHRHASERLQIETEMRQAIQNNDFRLFYQPIIHLGTGQLFGFEALLRWIHPDRGIIPPSEFVEVAEENGLIVKLGRWTVRESCRQLREWQDRYPSARDLIVSVNLSCKEFLQHDLAEHVSTSLSGTGLTPSSLKLEITETNVMENSDMAASIIRRLRAVGVEMSLDDFGTGYSSLSYLHRLPVSYLKIDRSFIGRMVESPENREIVHTIVKLAQNLKMKVIAEGIETIDQLTQLAELQCDLGQGFLFSKPVEPAAAELFIKDEVLFGLMPGGDTLEAQLVS